MLANLLTVSAGTLSCCVVAMLVGHLFAVSGEALSRYGLVLLVDPSTSLQMVRPENVKGTTLPTWPLQRSFTFLWRKRPTSSRPLGASEQVLPE